MKKRYVILTAIIAVICLLATVFVGCSQSEEEYYQSIEDDMKDFESKYESILANLQQASFTTEFAVERHFNAAIERGTSSDKGWDRYEKMYNALSDELADEDSNFLDDLFGTKSDRQQALADLGRETNAWYDQYSYVQYAQNGSDNFYFKLTVYPEIWENFYDDFTDCIGEDGAAKLEELQTKAAESQSDKYRYDTIKAAIDNSIVYVVASEDGVTKTSVNGGDPVVFETIEDGLTLLEEYGVHVGTFLSEDCVGFSNGNKIYTHVMQAQYRSVYAMPENAPVIGFETVPEVPASTSDAGWTTAIEQTIPQYLDSLKESVAEWQVGIETYFDEALRINLEENIESGNKYWSNFDEDISYVWDNIGAMTTARYTYDYNNKHSRLDQIDYYVERIMPYYVEENAVNQKLVLKADVFDSMHIVIDIAYGEDGGAVSVPTL